MTEVCDKCGAESYQSEGPGGPWTFMIHEDDCPYVVDADEGEVVDEN